MKKSKSDLTGVLVWLRNGIAFCFTWLLLLGIILCRIRGIKSVPVETLLRLFLFVCGGVFLFCLWFSQAVLRKPRFFVRLTGFFLTFTPFELLGFFWIGLFAPDETTTTRMIVFLCIILVFYLLCLLIDRFVCAKLGVKYTESLKRFQQREETQK